MNSAISIWYISQLLVAWLPVASGQVVQWEIQRQPFARTLHRRAMDVVQSNISNEQAQGGYFATVEVGTPGQKLALQLDTGSSDVWVPSSQAAICVNAAQGGCQLGAFNVERSSTFRVIIENGFDISYQDNSSSTGDYFSDRFQIASSTISNFTMGLGKQTDVSFGLIGIGYATNEASTDATQSSYPNLPIAMERAKAVNSVAYSLWLNDLGASSGSILFGGVDTAKYIGNLTRIPILPDSETDRFVHFAVPLFSLEAESPTGSDTLTSGGPPLNVILDSGTTLIYLPQALAARVWDEVGAAYDPQFQEAIIPCSYAKHHGHFSFTFSGSAGPRVNITMNELVLSLTGGEPPKFSTGPHRGQAACQFGIQNSTNSPYLLGDTFLRSAYVVYDLINNEVGIAATDFNTTMSNIIAFPSYGATIPSGTQLVHDTNTQLQPQPTQSGLSAAKGFQADSSGSSLRIWLPHGTILVGVTTLLAFLII